MGCFVSDVADGSQPVPFDLALISEVPGCDVGASGMERHVDVSAEIREEEVAVLREGVAAGVASPRVGQRSG